MQSAETAIAENNQRQDLSLLLDPDQLARKTLDGKPATNRQLSKRVAELMKGDPMNGIRPLSQNEVVSILGYKDKKSVRQLRKLAEFLGYFDGRQDPTEEQRREWKLPKELEEFKKHPDVAKWLQQMKSRAKGGRPFEGYNQHLKSFHKVCLTLKLDPHQFIAGANRDEILAQGIRYMDSFWDLYIQKKSAVRYSKNWNPNSVDKTIILYNYSKSVRDFMGTLGYPYPDGTGGSMSQSVASFHGKYADVRMTLEEYRKAKEFIKEKWGLDSDVFRWFAVGIEALPRKKAVHNMKNHFEEFTKKGRLFFEMTAIETKTIQYKKGKWKKMIFDADTQESIRLSKKHGDYIIAERSLVNAIKNIYPKLKEVYTFLDKQNLHCRIENDPNTSYFLEHPSHVLRHCGAQIWLRMTKWNVDFVASMGWKKAQELIDSYGEMPSDVRMEVIEDLKL